MSVRQFLSVALIATGILPILFFVFAFRPMLKGHIEDDIRVRSDAMLRTLSAQAGSSLLDGTRKDLPALLLLLESTGLEPSADRERAILRSFAMPHVEYSVLAALDAKGRVEASTVGAELDGAGYILHSELVPGLVSFSDPFPSSLTGEVSVEAAYSNGRRTIVALLDLGEISAKLVLIAQSPKDRLGVLDSEGRYLACSDPSRAQDLERVDQAFLAPRPAIVVSEGERYYAASSPVPGTSWRLLYLLYAATADAPMTAFMRSIAALVAAALACTVAFTLFARRNISAPLSALVSRIGRIADGSYSERVGQQLFTEFSEIGRAFNEMAESIEARGRELQRSEERHRLLFTGNRVPTLIVSPEDACILDANEAAIAFYGFAKERLLSMRATDLDIAAPVDVEAEIAAAAAGAEGHDSKRHRLASGEIRDVEIYASPIVFEKRTELYAVIVDVTERRLAEERTAKALEERTLLLREVYHRVKNNLQIISSLLNLQADGMTESATLRSLRVAQDRVYAMSVAHELVYQMDDLSTLRIEDYAVRLVSNLRIAYGVADEGVRTSFEPMALALEKAIPFGLALNELVSNAFKYAAPSPETPVLVSLELEAREGGGHLARFRVSDSGPGMKVELAPPGALGLSLVNALAKQLGGESRWSAGRSGAGIEAEISFPTEVEVQREEASV
jgi:PAS domain S-box